MTAVQPPRFAVWLLRRLGIDAVHESLVGDLVEQFAAGRSRLWFWRQALAAIVSSATLDVRAHYILALRALTLGALVFTASSVPVRAATRYASFWLRDWVAASGYYSFWTVFMASFVPATLLVWLACFGTGWIVARLHRGHELAAASLCAVSVCLWEYGMMAWVLASGNHRPVSTMELLLPAVFAAGRPLAILLGGLFAAGSRDDVSASAP